MERAFSPNVLGLLVGWNVVIFLEATKERRIMNLIAIIIQLVSGAAGGNLAGKLLKKIDLGVIGNSIAGIIGGGLGGQLLGLLGIDVSAGGGVDLSSILGSIASGGVGGGALMAIIGAIKSALAKGGN